jgi:hypothetical protein
MAESAGRENTSPMLGCSGGVQKMSSLAAAGAVVSALVAMI